jgi:hypothetical protein
MSKSAFNFCCNRFFQAAIATTLLSAIASPAFATDSRTTSPADSLGGPITPKVRVNTKDHGRDCQTFINLGLAPTECGTGGGGKPEVITIQKPANSEIQPSDRIRINIPVVTFP